MNIPFNTLKLHYSFYKKFNDLRERLSTFYRKILRLDDVILMNINNQT